MVQDSWVGDTLPVSFFLLFLFSVLFFIPYGRINCLSLYVLFLYPFLFIYLFLSFPLYLCIYLSISISFYLSLSNYISIYLYLSTPIYLYLPHSSQTLHQFVYTNTINVFEEKKSFYVFNNVFLNFLFLFFNFFSFLFLLFLLLFFFF